MEYNDRYGAIFINREFGEEPEIAKGVILNGLVDCIHKITIEENVFFGHDVKLLTGSHNPYKFGKERRLSSGGGPITIHEGVWIASFAIILGPCEIGRDSVVGAGSVVTHDVEPCTLVAGNPAKFIKRLI